jgi:transposase
MRKGGTLNVDRYSAYKTIAKAGLFILAFCWAHVRRDFLAHAKAYPQQEPWGLAWVKLIADLYHVNNQRILQKPGSPLFITHDRQLRDAVAKMHDTLNVQRADATLLPASKKVLDSLENHWEGLTIFVGRPEIPMDNNLAESGLRSPVVGRKGYYGSGSIWSAELAAVMFTILGTLKLAGMNWQAWLSAYLQECVFYGGKVPDAVERFLPWNMIPKVKELLSTPPNYEIPILNSS